MTNKRSLFIGAGGGNDVFSTLLAAAVVSPEGPWDAAGVWSPFHVHRGKGAQVAEWAWETTKWMDRVPRARNAPRVPLIDSVVCAMLADPLYAGPKPDRLLGVDLNGGSEAVKGLMDQYSHVYVVDVGGDIFYPGNEEPGVISPMFDSLTLAGAITTSAPQVSLLEMGPGTDGEISAEYLAEVLLKADIIDQLAEETVDSWFGNYARWIQPVRPGNTVRMTHKAFHSEGMIEEEGYRLRAHVFGHKLHTPPKKHVINADLSKHCYTFLIRDGGASLPLGFSNPLVIECDSAWGWVRKARQYWPFNCEANVETLVTPMGLACMATPSAHWPPELRRQIIAGCAAGLREQRCDLLIGDANDLRDAGLRVDDYGPWGKTIC